MQCFICGGQMRVAMVEPHVVDMQGFVGCGDVEKRPFFGGLVRLRGGTPNL
jgi:hypothetical protein